MTLHQALGHQVAWAILIAAIASASAASAATLILWRKHVRHGHIDGPWRVAYTALVLLVAWYDATTLAYYIAGSNPAAVMISALWATVAIAWSVHAINNRPGAAARRTVTTTSAAPDAFANAMQRKRAARYTYTQRGIAAGRP